MGSLELAEEPIVNDAGQLSKLIECCLFDLFILVFR